MKREQFEHVLRASADIINAERQRRGIDTSLHPATIIVIGSQAIHGTVNPDIDRNDRASLSHEVDLYVKTPQEDQYAFDNPDEELTNIIDGFIGEDTNFDVSNEVYPQGVDGQTAVLPDGWEDRLVEYQVQSINPNVHVFCIDLYDLCCAKLARQEPKDNEFIAALVETKNIEPSKLSRRLRLMRDSRFTTDLRRIAEQFIQGLSHPHRNMDFSVTDEELRSLDPNEIDLYPPEVQMRWHRLASKRAQQTSDP